MSRYLLDTDTLSLWRRAHPAVCRRVQAHSRADVAVSVITVEEQLSGWYNVLRQLRQPDPLARAYQDLAEAVSFLAAVPIVSFTAPAILRFEQLLKMRLNIGGMDLRIAGIALENGLIVVTRNQRDFGRVPGLVLEDWSV